MLNRFISAITHPEGHRHDVMRVVAFGVIPKRALQVVECDDVIAGVQRHRGGVDPLLRGFRGGRRLPGRLAFADAQVEARALEQLTLFRVSIEDRAEEARRAGKVVSLKRLDAPFVYRDRLIESRFAGCRRGRLRDRHRYRPIRGGTRSRRGGHGLPAGSLCRFRPFDAPSSSGGCLYGPALFRHAPPASGRGDSSKTGSRGSSGCPPPDRQRRICCLTYFLASSTRLKTCLFERPCRFASTRIASRRVIAGESVS